MQQEICRDGSWVCPEGSVFSESCPDDTCWGPPPLCCVDGLESYAECTDGEYACTITGTPAFGECRIDCPEEPPTCLDACGGSQWHAPLCVGREGLAGTWVCPAGSVDVSSC